jgi:NAD(P)-dependent dehydrogenase (short-subunit alcohol dehydrogenase family)
MRALSTSTHSTSPQTTRRTLFIAFLGVFGFRKMRRMEVEGPCFKDIKQAESPSMSDYLMRQKGRHITVTGAGTGIGKAIALRLASEGATLSLMARGREALGATAMEIINGGGRACVLPTDIRSKVEVDRSFAQAAQELGPLSAVIAVSGIGGPNADGDDDRFFDIVNTNLVGTYHCLRAAERQLAGDGRCDMVVISSILARIGVPGYSGYCASKAALMGLVRSLAVELAPRGVQVNAVCPGWVDTQMAHDGLQGMADAMDVSKDEAYQIAMQAVPRGRMGAPGEVAGMVAWLLSDDAAGVTGQGLDMNGGAFMA